MASKVRDLVQMNAMRFLRQVDKRVNRFYYGQPLISAPRAEESAYRALWDACRSESFPVVDAFEAETGVAVDKAWLDALALRTQVVIKKSPICYQHGRLLYAALIQYVRSSRSATINILETGTARGFSSVCMAKALKDSGAAGKIVTFDVLPHDAPIYWNCVADVEGAKSRSDLLVDYHDLLEAYIVFVQGDASLQLPKVQMPRVHFAFLDGAHRYSDVHREFATLKDKQLSGDVVFFDDYSTDGFPGVVSAVDEICEQYGYDKRVLEVTPERSYVIAKKV